MARLICSCPGGSSDPAEGVEHARPADDLRRLGCRFAPGYHFSKPVPDADVPQFLAGTGAPLEARAVSSGTAEPVLVSP